MLAAQRDLANKRQSVELARQQLERTDAQVRAGLIAWLGRAASRPEVRRVLAAHFHHEPELQLQRQIGTMSDFGFTTRLLPPPTAEVPSERAE